MKQRLINVFSTSYPKLLRYANSRLDNKEAAEDAVSSTFVNIAKINEEQILKYTGDPEAYVMTTLRNVCSEYHHKNCAYISALPPGEVESLMDRNSETDLAHEEALRDSGIYSGQLNKLLAPALKELEEERPKQYAAFSAWVENDFSTTKAVNKLYPAYKKGLHRASGKYVTTNKNIEYARRTIAEYLTKKGIK